MITGAPCYLMTRRGAMMPARFLSEVYGEEGERLFDLEAPGGQVYSCDPVNVYSREEGVDMLMQRRAEELPGLGYRIACRNDGTFRVYQVRKHGRRGGYLLHIRPSGKCVCSCPSYVREHQCKHVLAVCALLRSKAKNASSQGWKPGVSRYKNLASRLSGTPEEQRSEQLSFRYN